MTNPFPLPSANPSPVDLEEETEGGFKAKARMEEAEMDMTPMVDIVFQLLIFFMVTASFSLQKSMEVPKPKDDRPSTSATIEEPVDVIALTILVDHVGSFRIVSEEGDDEEEVPSEQELIVRLRQKKVEAGPDAVVTVLVKANGEAPHYRVVMAVDSAATAGFGKVGLQTIEDSE